MADETKQKVSKDEIRSIIATDCGSTTTKAILIERQGDEYRLIHRGEAPTTVEAPFEDVTMGVRNAVGEVEELTGKEFLGDEGVIVPRESDERGTDLYLSTSSAGGGLQMMVAGVVKTMSAESAERAALGAGAIVMDVIAVDDGREPHEKIARIRQLRPDMILFSGGIDGGTVTHVSETAELIAAADPKPRLGTGYELPVIYAGNKHARTHVKDTLDDLVDLRIVDNIRPVLEEEVLEPAREEIHNLFMEHVMAQAPGYSKLMNWTSSAIMPTPGAVGRGIQNVSEQYDMEVIGVDIGGATTDVFSVFQETFNRTVSANLGMSYSICNVLLETGLENIVRWLPFEVSEADLRNRIRNKMIRPTTIPQTLDALIIEQALAREALRLAFDHHKTLATGLKGLKRARDMGSAFEQETTESLVDMMTLGMVLGSGGVLSHAPRRIQAACMLMDAFQPQGVTLLAVDSIFMMPQLGVLSTVHQEASAQVFDRDCLIRLGTCIAPVPGQDYYRSDRLFGRDVVEVELQMPDGSERTETLKFGELRRIPLQEGETATAVIDPTRRFDVGAGLGRTLETEVEGGVCGLLLDARGRPLYLVDDPAERRQLIREWIESMDIYPADALARYIEGQEV